MHFSAVSVLDYRCGILLLFTCVMENMYGEQTIETARDLPHLLAVPKMNSMQCPLQDIL